MILIFAALFGFISVAFGSYAEHSLKLSISAEEFNSLMTAIRYNQLYAILISAIGLCLTYGTKEKSYTKLLKISGVIFTIGAVCFCFSIYLAILLNKPSLTYLTPFGGITLMIGWLSLFFTAIKVRS